MAMEINDSNLAHLANYISQTLSPDPNVRKPGKIKKQSFIQHKLNLFIRDGICMYL